MSQKVNPFIHRSNQVTRLNRQPTNIHEIFFSEPKRGKWGLNSYTRVFHEDQTIETYLEGFFRTFGFYQQTCFIERQCNQKVSVTCYVLRTPQSRARPNMIWRSSKEKLLQEGLDQGWIPALLLQTISKIVTYTSQTTSQSSFRRQALLKGLKGSNVRSKLPVYSTTLGTFAVHGQQPNITSVTSSNGDYNSAKNMFTEQSRFDAYWTNYVASQSSSPKGITSPVGELEGASPDKVSPSWWSHRTWHSTVYTPTTESTFDVTFNVIPVDSLASSSKLIADYMADKIEQSSPIQGLFKEVTEALELASNDQNSIELDNTKLSSSSITGFRISCSGRLQKNSHSKPQEMAESLTVTRGVLPLNSFKENIEFTQTSATNAFGTCGIKVWINRST
jgi:hypothetical protein